RVDAVIAADEHVPSKPRPDMVLHLCGLLRISPADAAVVGDTVADMQMGRAAGAGLLVGVLSGVTPATLLHPHADVIIPSIAELVAY
ncbi:MAG: HAD family hydrolase, partial [Chloroflexi bacterium]|nr:HAD family hydrolase [Chloroflexota bacterium]